MSADWIKVFKVAPHAVLMAVNEAGRGGACGVRLEGRVFGAKASVVKHFATPAAAAAFFAAYDEAAAEDWWRSLQNRVAEDFTAHFLRGTPPHFEVVGLLNA